MSSDFVLDCQGNFLEMGDISGRIGQTSFRRVEMTKAKDDAEGRVVRVLRVSPFPGENHEDFICRILIALAEAIGIELQINRSK